MDSFTGNMLKALASSPERDSFLCAQDLRWFSMGLPESGFSCLQLTRREDSVGDSTYAFRVDLLGGVFVAAFFFNVEALYIR